MQLALIVFAKTPGLSKYKTRLAKTVGAQITETFYKGSLLATKSVGHEVANKLNNKLDFYIGAAEVEAVGHSVWEGEKLLIQSTGDLAKRQSDMYQKLKDKYEGVFFIGADSPHLDPTYLANQIQSFMNSDSDFLLGPADDGGYYLFGGKQSLELSDWSRVEYSADDTCIELSKVLTEKGKLEVIETNFDIDNIETLKKMSLLDTSGMTDQQKSLISWSKSLCYDIEIS